MMLPLGCFAFFAPKLFKNFEQRLEGYYKLDRFAPHFSRPFDSVFPATTFNLGLKVETVEHCDYKNKANGWLAVTAVGKFNPEKGGHLILRDFGLVIEFPPGSTILFPSAIVQHGNVPIRPGETRMSITQFAAGGLFRYADYGYRTERVLREQDPNLWQTIYRQRIHSWDNVVRLYSHVNELDDDRDNIFFRQD